MTSRSGKQSLRRRRSMLHLTHITFDLIDGTYIIYHVLVTDMQGNVWCCRSLCVLVVVLLVGGFDVFGCIKIFESGQTI
jgi:hypothetical protein